MRAITCKKHVIALIYYIYDSGIQILRIYNRIKMYTIALCYFTNKSFSDQWIINRFNRCSNDCQTNQRTNRYGKPYSIPAKII